MRGCGRDVLLLLLLPRLGAALLRVTHNDHSRPTRARTLSGKELQVGGFDLVWKNGPVPRTQNVSFLGSANDQSTPIEEICKVKRARAVTKAAAAAAAAAVV